MRYIPRNCLTENAVLAKPIWGNRGEVLLQSGVKMTNNYIKRLEQLGINGAYVDDPLSEGLEIVDAISNELRTETVRLISSIYTGSVSPVSKNSSVQLNSRQVMKMAEQIVDEIIDQKNTVINLIDIKTYDTYTFLHCVNTAVLCVIVGLGMKMRRDELADLAYSSLMHDIGKLFIDNAIINKPGKLTEDEYATIKRHSAEGYKYLKDMYKSSEKIARGVGDHHEKFDGSGYPKSKKGPEISLFGRIISVADVYDALISDRSYRKGIFPAEAIEYIQSGAGTSFDFDIISVFSEKVAPFPVGTCVLLSNGSAGIVTENVEGFLMRPMLRVFKDSDEKEVTPYELNLSRGSFDVTIIETLRM